MECSPEGLVERSEQEIERRAESESRIIGSVGEREGSVESTEDYPRPTGIVERVVSCTGRYLGTLSLVRHVCASRVSMMIL